MSNISILARIVNGVARNVDLSTNTLVVSVVKVGGGSGTDLTKTILDRLVSLQNGTDVGATYHTHDTLYTRTSALASTSSGSAGSTLIGDDNSYSHFTPTAATVKGALAGIDTALGSASSALDGTFRIKNTADNTKQIAFDASGITTGTTRTVTMPDANVDLGKVATAIQKDGSVTFTANQPMGSYKLTGLSAGTTAGDSVRYEQAILASGVNAFAADQSFGGFKATNLADPVGSQDAVTLSYLQARLNGLTPKAPVKAATTANITLSGAQTIDTVSIIAGDRVLVKNQSSAAANGIYVAASGSWTRATDMDSLTPFDEVSGAWVPVQEGSQAGQVFVQYGTVTAIGTDPINFAFYNPIAGLIGGDMITFAGSAFSVDLATASGLESTNPGNVAGQLRIKLEASSPSLNFTGSNELAVKFDAAGAILAGASGVAVQVDGSTIEISSNALRVKDAGITLAKLASNSVDENKIASSTFSASGAITGGGGTKVAVQVDGTSVEINSNALRVKSGAYDQATITGGSGTAAAVQYAPAVKMSFVAGQSFSANTTYAVRYGIPGLSETAGRVYAADYDTTTNDKFWVIGLFNSGSAISAGQSITVVVSGALTLGSSDTTFSSGDQGYPVFLGASGAILPNSSAPATALQAVFKLGIAASASVILVDRQMMGVN